MLESWILNAAQRIGEGMHAKRVLVFGSRATGKQSRRSDLDLFIECETEMRPLDRIGRALDLAGELPCSLDAIVYTPREVDHQSHSKFLQRILAEGVVAYDAATVER